MIDYTLPLDQLPDPLLIEPLTKPFEVTIRPPGSKSITNRVYVLAALAEGESKIIRPLRSEDTDGLLNALCTLGVEARWKGEDVYIKGVNGRFPKGGEVNLGDGGTPTRFMIAAACLAAEPVTVDGSARMRERPIAEGVDMLRQLGATIEYVEEEGRLPVRVVPSDDFKGGMLEVGRTQSSQFVSAVLLIAPWLKRGVDIRFTEEMTSAMYVNLSVGALIDYIIEMGLPWETIETEEDTGTTSEEEFIRVPPLNLKGIELLVEPDASSSLYWFLAAIGSPQSRITIPGSSVYSGQPDMFLIAMFDDMGASMGPDDAEEAIEYTWVWGGSDFRAISYDGSEMPDGVVAYAAVAAHASGKSHITGLHTLRVKETDRIAALANELRKVGCTIETTIDSITIDPSTRHNDPVVIETYNDHRMAMAFAVLGLARPGISIRNPACVAKSYPGFWQDFATLYA